MYNRLSVSFFLIVTFVSEPVGQFQQKIAKIILVKGKLKSLKRMVTPFFKRNIFELLEISWQIKMKNLFLNNNFARNT